MRLAVTLLFLSFSVAASSSTGAEPDVILQKDVDRQASLAEKYPIKVCVGSLAYSGMAAKNDDSRCRDRSDITYDDCMKIPKKGRDFTQVVINKTVRVKTGDIIYLKKNLKYSFFTGSGGIVKDFSNESKSTFVFGTANYGGVALDPIKKCP